VLFDLDGSMPSHDDFSKASARRAHPDATSDYMKPSHVTFPFCEALKVASASMIPSVDVLLLLALCVPSRCPSSDMNAAGVQRILEEIQGLRGEVSVLRTEVTSLRTEVRGLRTTIAGNSVKHVGHVKSNDLPAARRVIPQPATLDTATITRAPSKKNRTIPRLAASTQQQMGSQEGWSSPEPSSPEPDKWRVKLKAPIETSSAKVPEHLTWLRKSIPDHHTVVSGKISSTPELDTRNLPFISPGGTSPIENPNRRFSDLDDLLGLHMYGYDDLSQDSEGCDICGGSCSRMDGCVNDDPDGFFD
jgi:hypothetical protein